MDEQTDKNSEEGYVPTAKSSFFLDFSTCLYCFSILYMYIKISKLDRCCCSYQDKYKACVMFLLKKYYSLRIGAEQSGQM